MRVPENGPAGYAVVGGAVVEFRGEPPEGCECWTVAGWRWWYAAGEVPANEVDQQETGPDDATL